MSENKPTNSTPIKERRKIRMIGRRAKTAIQARTIRQLPSRTREGWRNKANEIKKASNRISFTRGSILWIKVF